MNNFSLFSERLKIERKRLGLSQADAAKECGVSREIWGKYERGVVSAGSDVLFSFCEIGADIHFLFTGQRIGEQCMKSPREAALLDNYRAAPEDGKRALEMSALAFASGIPQPVKKAKKAEKGMVQSGSHNVQIGGNVYK